MSTTVFVVVLVVGILAVLVLIWIPILVWLRRRSRAVAEQLASELEGETIVRAPEKGSYSGATAPGYPTVKNTGLHRIDQAAAGLSNTYRQGDRHPCRVNNRCAGGDGVQGVGSRADKNT